MARKICCNHTCIDIDAMFRNNTPYLNFWHHCATENLLDYDEEAKTWYPAIGIVLFTPASENEQRNQLFRDFLDELEILWEDFLDN